MSLWHRCSNKEAWSKLIWILEAFKWDLKIAAKVNPVLGYPILCTHLQIIKPNMDFLTSPVYDVAHFHTVLEILTTFEHITQDTLFNISLCYSRMGNGLSWNSFFWLVTILHNCITVTFLLSTIALNTICLE